MAWEYSSNRRRRWNRPKLGRRWRGKPILSGRARAWKLTEAVPPHPRVHRHRGRLPRGAAGDVRAVLRASQHGGARGPSGLRQPRSLLPEQQDAGHRQVVRLQRHRAGGGGRGGDARVGAAAPLRSVSKRGPG